MRPPKARPNPERICPKLPPPPRCTDEPQPQPVGGPAAAAHPRDRRLRGHPDVHRQGPGHHQVDPGGHVRHGPPRRGRQLLVPHGPLADRQPAGLLPAPHGSSGPVHGHLRGRGRGPHHPPELGPLPPGRLGEGRDPRPAALRRGGHGALRFHHALRGALPGA